MPTQPQVILKRKILHSRLKQPINNEVETSAFLFPIVFGLFPAFDSGP